MKEPRRDGRPPSDPARSVTETLLDLMLGSQSGVGDLPHPLTHVVTEPDAHGVEADPGVLLDEPARASPALRPAVLGQLHGTGLILVVRDDEGDVVDVDGVWRPDDPSAGETDLRTTFPEGSTTGFAGSRLEVRSGVGEQVDLAVVIDRHGTYATDDGRTLHLVCFTPREPG
jgi:hypothetical protein